MAPSVSVIIVNYNGRELLDECIGSVVEFGGGNDQFEIETILVDNGSDDGSAAYVRARFPHVRCIEAQENRGFAAGTNLGIAAAQAPLLLLLNSDARITEGTLPAMLAVINSADDIGQVGPRLRGGDGRLQRSARAFPTWWRLATEYLYLRKLAPRSRLFNAFYAGWFDYDSDHDMDFLMGACLLVRRSAIDTVGVLDESYFMFSEETDWADRFWQAHWRIRFCAACEVIHLGGQSTRKQWLRMYASQACGSIRFLAKRRSVARARRAQRLVSGALALRIVVYRAAAIVMRALGYRARDRAMLERASAFASARSAVRALDVRAEAATEQPDLPELQARLAVVRGRN